MKKFLLLLFIPILSLFTFNTNEVHAQQINYPNYIMLASYNYFYEPVEYTNTYDFVVDYTIDNICINQINQNDYFLVDVNGIGFRKGIDRRTNSYQIRTVWCSSVPYTRTWIQVNITVLKSYAYDNYNYPDNEENIELLFSHDTALYILYPIDTNSIEYQNGYDIGYDTGYDTGYNNGYNAGYNAGLVSSEAYHTGYNKGKQDGYDEASKEFRENFGLKVDIWLVPAIIIVFAVGIFVTYRKRGD